MYIAYLSIIYMILFYQITYLINNRLIIIMFIRKKIVYEDGLQISTFMIFYERFIYGKERKPKRK